MFRMNTNQSKIVESPREVHAITVKEIEKLNLKILELETQNLQLKAKPIEQPPVTPTERPAINRPPFSKQSSIPDQPEMLNETQLAKWLNLSVASVRRWRLFQTGPNYLEIGAAVRYRRGDVESWLNSCSGLR